MTLRWPPASLAVVASGLAAVACGAGARAPQPAPAASSSTAAVRGFLEAVADSNIATMARLWGTARGPAAATNVPPDWERRVTVMQAFLRHDGFRIVSDVAEGGDARRAVQVELQHLTCTRTVPFVAIRIADGTWLVNQVDLAAAGNPARPCADAPADSAGTG